MSDIISIMKKLIEFDPGDDSIDWLEDEIQAYIVQQLRRMGVLFAASLEGAFMTKRTAAKLKMLGMESGEPDLRIYLDGGRVLFVELKRKKGQLSHNQKKRIESLRALGHNVEVIYAKTPLDGWNKVSGMLGYENQR